MCRRKSRLSGDRLWDKEKGAKVSGTVAQVYFFSHAASGIGRYALSESRNGSNAPFDS